MSRAAARQKIRLGISPCPNDTFAFCALMHRWVDWQGLEFEIRLCDIQELNELLQAGDLDVGKASFHAALWLAERYVVLPAGSALGFGAGPLLLAARRGVAPTPYSCEERQLTLCPGRWTTAALLYEMFFPQATRVQHVVFSEIMPALQAHQADFGVCIHEGRFTYEQYGLALVEDLGTRWERETGHPLPLGGMLASRRLSSDTRRTVSAIIAESLRYAWQAPELTLPTMRQYAREFDEQTLMRHVELYVNDWTLELGAIGRAALFELSRRAGVPASPLGALLEVQE